MTDVASTLEHIRNTADHTFRGVINPADLPKALQAQAKDFQKFQTRLEEAHDEVSLAQNDVEAANHRDAEALRTALLNDKPDPGYKHAEAAAQRIKDAIRTLTSLNSIVNEKGPQFRDQLWEHREGIAALLAPKLRTALDNYTSAVTEANKAISAAALEIDQTVGVLGLINDLDTRKPLDIGYDPTTAPRIQTDAAQGFAAQIHAALDGLTTPAQPDYVIVDTPNGVRMEGIKRDTAEALVKHGSTITEYAAVNA